MQLARRGSARCVAAAGFVPLRRVRPLLRRTRRRCRRSEAGRELPPPARMFCEQARIMQSLGELDGVIRDAALERAGRSDDCDALLVQWFPEGPLARNVTGC